MRHSKISLAGPWITQKEMDYAADAVKNGWYDTYTMHIDKLEEAFANYIGVKHAIATFSGTHALHLCTLALNLSPGDEVIIPDQSFVASAYVVSYVGGKCVFVDIEPNHLCIEVSKIEQAITDKTKAIMPVHLMGFSADMDPILDLAKRYDLYVIEDAAQGVGLTYQGKHVGSIGDVAAFSFQGAKIAVCGEGGMFVTNDTELYNRAKHYGNFCRNDAVAFMWMDDIGYKTRMSNVSAAIALAQIERIDELISNKKRIYDAYYDRLKGRDYLTPHTSGNCSFESNYAYVSTIFDASIDTKRVIGKLLELNIHTRPGSPSMSLLPMYNRTFPAPVSDHFYKHGMILPHAANLTEEDIDFVCSSLDKIVKGQL